MSFIAPPPLYSNIIRDRSTLKLDKLADIDWIRWFNSVQSAISSSYGVLRQASLTDQSASISATSLPVSTLTDGMYRLNYYARITRAATTSSSLTITIQWTHLGVVCTFATSALTGNTTTSYTQGTVAFRADLGTNVTYATTYASSGATSMQYSLAITLESLS